MGKIAASRKWRYVFIVCLGLALPCPWAAAMATQASASAKLPEARRLALVIGNGAYANHPLANPAADARAMGAALRSLGFEVLVYGDLDRAGMGAAIRTFQEKLAAGGVGLFYFSGHGFQWGGKAWLLPVDAAGREPADLAARSIDLGAVLAAMAEERPGKANLVLVDTCLTDTSQAGAAPVIPAQSLVAYAAAPGGGAGDGRHHGIFTAALLQELARPEPTAEEAVKQAGKAVRRLTAGRQAPWALSALAEDIPLGFHTGSPATLVAAAWPETAAALDSRGILPKDSAEQYELTFWESIKDSTHPEDYEAYLQAYPKGRFATLARSRMERLRAAAPKAEAAPQKPQPAAKAVPEKPAAPPAAKAAPEKPTPAPVAKSAPEKPAPLPAPQAVAGKSGAAAAKGSEVKDCPACPTLVSLPAGSFTMGSNAGDLSEKPPHPVSIKAPFAIGKFEVTVEEWNACAEAGACPKIAAEGTPANRAPMRNVSWDDAQQYVQWLAKTSGKPYRLPSEAEWEYAARGGTSSLYWWGDQMRQGNADCKDCGQPWRAEGPANVGSFAANPFGLYDMNGSVWEWVSDCWHSSYKGAPSDGAPWNQPDCRVRVIRGGSWREGASYMLSSTRFKYDADVRQSQNGFRVARDLK